MKKLNSHILPHIIQKYNKQKKHNKHNDYTKHIYNYKEGLSWKALNRLLYKKYNSPLPWTTKCHGPKKT